MDQKPVSLPPTEVGNVPAPAPQPVVTIASASEAVQEFIRRLPSLYSVQKELELIAGLHVAYVANPLGSIPVKDAIKEIGTLYHTDLSGIRDALAAITRIDAQAVSTFADEFQTRTGRRLNIRTLNVADTVNDENQEQQTEDRLARELLVKVQTVVNRLGVNDLYTLHQTDKKKAVRGSVLVNLVNRTAEHFSKSEKVVPAESAPDWLTPPILNPENDPENKDEYHALVEFIDMVIGLMDRYANQSNMRQIVLDYLKPAKIDAAKIEASLERASELAHDQLKQSSDILALVGHDQQVFADRIDGLTDLRYMYGGVAKFFFPN